VDMVWIYSDLDYLYPQFFTGLAKKKQSGFKSRLFHMTPL
jgi:hypothetical protein